MNDPSKILLIDDRTDNLALLEAILEPEGYEIHKFLSGRQALENIQSMNPDLILLDAMMPDMDGFAICRELRKRLKTRFIPVIMITVLTELDDRIKGLEAGADDFISKPIIDALLLAKIRSMLKLKQMRDDLDELKHDFNNMIVHDLRAPVHSIQGLVDLLREIQPSDGSHTRLLDLIEKSTDKINNLITDVLDLGKLEAGELKLDLRDADFVEVIGAAVENFKLVGQKKNIKFTLRVNPSVIRMSIDPERIDQVISNLLQNAIKFSPSGGEITVTIHGSESEVQCAVTDQGPGLPDGDMGIIFQKYIQSVGRDSGVGLGLYVCKTIVEAHNGSIWAENNPGGGALFIFKIPVLRQVLSKV